MTQKVKTVRCDRCLAMTAECPRCGALGWINTTGDYSHHGWCPKCDAPITEPCKSPDVRVQHRDTCRLMFWASIIAIAVVLALAVFGCADSDKSDECQALVEVGKTTLERAIRRSARAAIAGYDIIEGSGTWYCDGDGGLEMSIDYDLIFPTSRRHLTMILYNYNGVEYFEIERR